MNNNETPTEVQINVIDIDALNEYLDDLVGSRSDDQVIRCAREIINDFIHENGLYQINVHNPICNIDLKSSTIVSSGLFDRYLNRVYSNEVYNSIVILKWAMKDIEFKKSISNMSRALM